MIIYTPCKICGNDMPLHWGADHPTDPTPIHLACDTRPPGLRDEPHPAEGNLARLAHHTTLAIAAAKPTPPNSPEWAEVDRLSTQIRQVQHNTLFPDLKWAATYYATRLGWPVFPLKPGTKEPLTRHGFHDATTDPHQVTQWWDTHPHANIGLPTGINFDVVDVDTPIFRTHWARMLNDDTAEGHGLAGTASGGYHLYVKPGESEAKNRAKAFGPGIDYRTKGGYVVAPWSRIGNRCWSWHVPPSTTISPKKV